MLISKWSLQNKLSDNMKILLADLWVELKMQKSSYTSLLVKRKLFAVIWISLKDHIKQLHVPQIQMAEAAHSQGQGLKITQMNKVLKEI